MNTLTSLTLAALSLSTLSAQDILHYKFEAGCGDTVINFADGTTVGSGKFVCTLPNSPASAWTQGKWGGGMAGSDKSGGTGNNYLQTGWNIGTFTGSFSISMWIRNKPGNPSAIAFGYLFGAIGSSFRCFTGSSGKLFVGGWGGSPGNLVNTADLTTLLNAGWTHVALVVDDSNKVATYYINGTADAPITLTGNVSFTGTDFRVGLNNSTSTSPMDFDEFLFTRRVLTPAEVTALSTSPQAGAGPIGTGNPARLIANGRPNLGNLLFNVTIQDTQAQSYYLYIGSNRCSLLNGPALPLDLGTLIPAFTGVNAYTDIDLFAQVGNLAQGQAIISLPVLNLPSASGVTAYFQAYTVTPQATLRGANGLAISPGH